MQTNRLLLQIYALERLLLARLRWQRKQRRTPERGRFHPKALRHPRETRGVGRGGISCSGTGFLGAPRKVTGERSGVFKSEFCVLVIGQAYQVHSKHVSRNVKPSNYHHE